MQMREERRMGLTILASVAGTLALVGVVALVMLRGKEPSPQEPSTGAVSQDSAKAPSTATAPTTVATGTADPPPTTTSTTPTTTLSALPPAPTATAKAPPTPTGKPDKTADKPTPVPTTAPPATTAPPTSTVPTPTAPAGGGSGFLTVVCKPACDSVVVKGRNLGPSPVINVSFPAGTYPVVLKRSGSSPKATSVTIVAGKNTPLRMNMLTPCLPRETCLLLPSSAGPSPLPCWSPSSPRASRAAAAMK
jgi:cytoskeletal protein RodZ